MPRVTHYWSPIAGVFLGIWLSLVLIGPVKLCRDPGTFWHTVVGQHILREGRPITEDPFSFTRHGERWPAQQWLAEVLMAVLHEIGGLSFLVLVTVTALAGLFTWIFHRFTREGLHWLPALLLTGLAAMASSSHFLVRPHLFTIAFLGSMFAWLCDVETGRLPFRRLFWLVPLFILWTNLHGGVLGGLATLGLAVGAWAVAGRLHCDSPLRTWRQMLLAAGLVAACGLTVLVNPYGVELVEVWLFLSRSSVLPELIIEHAPLYRSGLTGWVVVVFGVIYVAALAGTLPKRPRVSWFLPLVWFALAWTRIRHGPLFAVTAAVALADMIPHVRWVGWLSRHGFSTLKIRPVSPEGTSRGWRPLLLPAVVVLSVLSLQAAGITLPILGLNGGKLDRTYWPVDLLPELRGYARGKPEGTPIFNEMLFGGFLIYHTPSLRVFIDDRCELYGEEGLLAYARAAARQPEQIEVWATQYGFEMALVEHGSTFDRYLARAEGWTLVRRVEAAALYRRDNATKGDPGE